MASGFSSCLLHNTKQTLVYLGKNLYLKYTSKNLKKNHSLNIKGSDPFFAPKQLLPLELQ
jgi:hypothetical protein